MAPELTLRIGNRPSELRRLRVAVEGYCVANAVGLAVTTKLVLILEELLGNLFVHAAADDGERQIDVELTRDETHMWLLVSDDGPPFDPLTAPLPSLAGSLEERAVGGIGLHLVRGLLAEPSYERRSGRNRLQGRLVIR